MTIRYCDICGASFPDTEEHCPVCGLGRSLESETPYSEHTHSEHQKVRGGRYSKKNVKKRLQEQAEEAPHVPVEAPVSVHAAAPVAEEAPIRVPHQPQPIPEEDVDDLDIPMVLPAESAGEAEKRANLAVYRREVRLNLLLLLALAVFLLSAGFLVWEYAIPYAQGLGWLPYSADTLSVLTGGVPRL